MKISIYATSFVALALSIAADLGSNFPIAGGINIAGFEFGRDIWDKKSGTGEYQLPNNSQFIHFAKQGANIFRIPIGWVHLQPNLNGPLNSTVIKQYKQSIQAALATGSRSRVIIDVHNYARYQGNLIGQTNQDNVGGPTNLQFANLWSQLATIFNDTRIIYGIMNEPHDLDMNKWVDTVQAAVNAIRKAGSKDNFLLLPGDHFGSLINFTSISAPYLEKITDPAHKNITDYLIYDVHVYYQLDNSGQSDTCASDRIPEVKEMVTYLKEKNRTAFLSETGGGNNDGCVKAVRKTVEAVKISYPYFLGFAVWSAGAFDTGYELTVTPNSDGSDQKLWKYGIKPLLPMSSSL